MRPLGMFHFILTPQSLGSFDVHSDHSIGGRVLIRPVGALRILSVYFISKDLMEHTLLLREAFQRYMRMAHGRRGSSRAA